MDNHPSIDQTSQGDIFELDDIQFPYYPVANVSILGANFDEKNTDYSIQLIVADKVKNKNNESEPRTNEQIIPFYDINDVVDIHANTMAILNDLLSYTQYSVQSFEIIGTINNEPFADRFNNGLAGWVSTFTLRTHNDRPRCLWDLYPFSSSQQPTCPTAGTLLSTYCVGYDKYGTYADGVCGTYNALIQTNSPDCGYVPGTDYNYYQINGCCFGTEILAVTASITNFNPTIGQDVLWTGDMCGFVAAKLEGPQTPNHIWSSSAQIPINEYGNGDCKYCNEAHYDTISVIPGCLEYSFAGFQYTLTASYTDCNGNNVIASGSNLTFCSQTKPVITNRTGDAAHWSYYIDCTGCHI